MFRSETSVVNMFKVNVQYTDLVVLLSVMQPQVFREITNLHILSFNVIFYYNTLLFAFFLLKNLSNNTAHRLSAIHITRRALPFKLPTTKYVVIKSTTVYSISPRRNWDSPNPSLTSECAPPPRTGERVGTLACG